MELTNNTKLVLVKLLHTLVWLFYNVVIFYLLYAAVVGKIDKWIWICLGLVVLEGLALLAFKNFCPLTIVARNYSQSKKDNFDIYIPNWLAKYNKMIYTVIVLIAVVMLIFRMIGR